MMASEAMQIRRPPPESSEGQAVPVLSLDERANLLIHQGNLAMADNNFIRAAALYEQALAQDANAWFCGLWAAQAVLRAATSSSKRDSMQREDLYQMPSPTGRTVRKEYLTPPQRAFKLMITHLQGAWDSGAVAAPAHSANIAHCLVDTSQAYFAGRVSKEEYERMAIPLYKCYATKSYPSLELTPGAVAAAARLRACFNLGTHCLQAQLRPSTSGSMLPQVGVSSNGRRHAPQDDSELAIAFFHTTISVGGKYPPPIWERLEQRLALDWVFPTLDKARWHLTDLVKSSGSKSESRHLRGVPPFCMGCGAREGAAQSQSSLRRGSSSELGPSTPQFVSPMRNRSSSSSGGGTPQNSPGGAQWWMGRYKETKSTRPSVWASNGSSNTNSPARDGRDSGGGGTGVVSLRVCHCCQKVAYCSKECQLRDKARHARERQ